MNLRPLWAAVAGAAVGLVCVAGIRLWRHQGPDSPPATVARMEQSVAWHYARAFQEGNWDYVIDHTLWMQEYLANAAARAGAAENGLESRLALSRTLGDRSSSGNRLADTGVEDQYVFTPGAVIEVVAHDEGRDDLEQPARERVWLRVQYPDSVHSLFDDMGLPIRSVVVGVNVSEDGYVLKANVEGNLDVDWDGIVYWATQP